MQKLVKEGLKKPNKIIKLAALNSFLMTAIGAAGGHKNDWSEERKRRFTRAQVYQTGVSLGN